MLETMENQKDLFSAIRVACESQITTLVTPSMERLARIRALLDAYEVNIRSSAEHHVMGKLLSAIGQETPPSPEPLEDIEDQLFNELDGMTPDWAKAAPVKAQPVPVPPPEPVPAPVVVPPAAKAPELTVIPKAHVMPDPSDDDVQKARELIHEVEATNYADGHPLRMGPLMQAHVAEVRILLNRIPENHPIGWQLTQLISRLARAKQDAGIAPYIRGLSRNHGGGDWGRISFESRKVVAKFDVDAERPAAEAVNGAAKKAKEREPDRPSMFNWPPLPKLRDRLKNGPLYLVGGVAVPNKLSSVHARFGVAAEWHEVEDSSPRQINSLVEKIKKGKVGAVVCLKGLMGRDAWKDIQDACKATGVPFTLGDKGGLGDIQTALDHLEVVA